MTNERELTFKLYDLISPEEQTIMRMAVSRKKYAVNPKEFQRGKIEFRRNPLVETRAARRLMNTVCRKQWFNPKTGKEISFFLTNATSDIG